MLLSVDGRFATVMGFAKETLSELLAGKSRSMGDVSSEDVSKVRG